MKKFLLSLGLIYFWTVAVSVGHAQPAAQNPGNVPLQNITLHDGTVLKGQLIEVQGDTYVIKTNQLGMINIKASEISSLTPATVNPMASPMMVSNPPTSETMSAGTMPINPLSSGGGQQSQMAQQFLQDPEISASIKEVLQDPEIMNLLKDPSLMGDALSMDPQKIQNNENIKTLMQNPKMQEIMAKMAQKMNLQSGSSPAAPSAMPQP